MVRPTSQAKKEKSALVGEVTHDDTTSTRSSVPFRVRRAREHAHKDDPRHLLTLIPFRNKVGSQNARQQLEKGAVDLEHGEEEEEGDGDVEGMSCVGFGGGDTNEERAEGVGDQETTNELSERKIRVVSRLCF